MNEGWLYRVQGKGTYVDRRPDLSSPPSKVIAVMAANLEDYTFPQVMKGIDGILSGEGYNILLCCTYNQYEKERMHLEKLLNLKIDGLIIEPTKSALPNPNIELYKELSSRGIPVLFIHGVYNNLDYSYVVEDDAGAGYLAASHLTGLGHRKIGGVFRIDDKRGHGRYEGHQRACREDGIKLNDSNVVWFDAGKPDGGFGKEFEEEIRNLLGRVSAVVCQNEQTAVKVAGIARDMGVQVPHGVSLISLENSGFAEAASPKLTAVSYPGEDLGMKAAESILQMIERKTNYFDITVRPEIIVRESTCGIGESWTVGQ